MSRTDYKLVEKLFTERMDRDIMQNCMRCGSCIPACPTYAVSGGSENSTPRGRIALMKAVTEGIIKPNRDFETMINECIGCLACESACPSGVNYMELINQSKEIIAEAKKHPVPVRAFRKVLFNGLFENQKNMRRFMGLLRFYQKSGIQTLTHKTGVIHIFPNGMTCSEKVLPKIEPTSKMGNRPLMFEAKGEKRATVSFLTGCLMETMFLRENNKTIRLLQAAGCEVKIPRDQVCCGAMQGHSGDKPGAIELAKKNIIAFEEAEYIVSNAGGCGAFLMEYEHIFHGDPEWEARANAFVAKVKDISKILVELEFHKRVKLSLPEQIITYQDSCHLRNVMKTFKEPRSLLNSIEGIHFIELKGHDSCCGSGGSYSVLQNKISMEILDRKMQHVLDTRAAVVVTANPGCLLQMKVGVDRINRRDDLKVVHIVDVLFDAAGIKYDF